MDVLAWLWWSIVTSLGLLWALIWFLISGWVSTLLQIALLIIVHHHDVIPEEVGRFCPGVGDDGLRFGQGELAGFLKHSAELALDGLGLRSRSRKPQEEVIGIPYISTVA